MKIGKKWLRGGSGDEWMKQNEPSIQEYNSNLHLQLTFANLLFIPQLFFYELLCIFVSISKKWN